MTFERRTIERDVVFEGLGLHSGVPVVVTIRPSDQGILFRCPAGAWSAVPENVTDTTRCTRLGEISTIEHLMSALCGMELTDVDIELTANELPAMDGSSKPFVEGLAGAGNRVIGERTLRPPYSRLYVHDGEAKVAVAAGEGHWRYEFVTGMRWPGAQVFEVTNLPEGYAESIAPARTFGFEDEVPHLHAMGLARGLDLTSALVLGREGYVNEPRFSDEPARHKLLDAIGDLYLAGVPARFLSVVAERSGHRLHVDLAARLAEAVSLG